MCFVKISLTKQASNYLQWLLWWEKESNLNSIKNDNGRVETKIIRMKKFRFSEKLNIFEVNVLLMIFDDEGDRVCR